MLLNNTITAMKEPSFVLDETDLLILEHMAQDANVSFKQLAESLKVDQRTIAKRISEMKQNGVLKTKIEIDWPRLGLGIATYVGAETGLGEKDVAKLQEYIRKEPRITEAYSTIGGQEYFFKVVETDLQSLRDVLLPFEPITSKLTSSIISSNIKEHDDVTLLHFLRQRGFSRKKKKTTPG